MNMQKLLRQAEEMQEKMQRQLTETQVDVSVGGGLVSCSMNGHKQLLGMKIDPEAMDPEDTSMLEDLVVAAVNEAQRKIEDKLRSSMGSMAGHLQGLF